MDDYKTGEGSKKYFAQTPKGGFIVYANNVKEAWKYAKEEANNINLARLEFNMGHLKCKVLKIKKYQEKV